MKKLHSASLRNDEEKLSFQREVAVMRSVHPPLQKPACRPCLSPAPRAHSFGVVLPVAAS